MLDSIIEDFIELQNPLRRVPETETIADAIAVLDGSFRAASRNGKMLTGIVPMVPPRQGIHPPNTKLIDASVSFRFGSSISKDSKIEDVFSEMQVCVRGKLPIDGGFAILEDHWRIDTQANESGNPPKESHPLFHFQRGGHAQDAFAAVPGFAPGPDLKNAGLEWRGLMQNPGPRIPVVPMCPSAAINFALAQHDGTVWRRLMNDPDYFNLIERCQNRLWTMYADALLDEKRRRMLLGHFIH
ncbi:hypothetical protein FHX10_006744 [Rhizobium sp. BK591]|uniref:hypothetical protein n=1 Tax=Rhizobium sp. BK591 TaxID=2586985 RepID=UPI000DDD1EC8|nr:hypothetical protein [Rhizobium sp. BK591]MBB3747188.1 hypothetical protein [Rhizobium sp. BK591]